MKSTPRLWGERALRIALGLVVLFEVVTLGGAGVAKFLNAAAWSAWFASWGYPPGFSYVVGVVEVGAALLLIPARSSSYAGGVLLLVMLGALVTVLRHPGQLGPGAPLLHGALLMVIVALRWKSRLRPDGSGRRRTGPDSMHAGGADDA